MVVVAIREATPKGIVKDHSVNEAVVVRTRKEIKRKDGSYIRFDDNAVVILEKGKKTPMGTRIFGPISRELKDRGYDKIASLAPEVI
jgi:large subunit ribosomal protein L14